MDKSCITCGSLSSTWPMTFKGEAWCSEDCRKAYVGERNEFFTITMNYRSENEGLDAEG